MRGWVLVFVVAFVVQAACDSPPEPAPVFGEVYQKVDEGRMLEDIKETSGVVPVTVGDQTFTISERYSDVGRQEFLAYWQARMEAFGLTVRPIDYQSPSSTRPGHDLEALLPGRSPDSVIVVVHYDSIGPAGLETANPGADDDMTGMAILLETARLLAPYRDRLEHTVRFVATDEEEEGNLAGATAYADQIKQEAAAGGWTLIAAIDDEQTGWSCHAAGLCPGQHWPAVDIFDCTPGGAVQDTAFGDQLADVYRASEPDTAVVRDCLGPQSDMFAFWDIGMTALTFTEHAALTNPHFDQQGGDSFDTLDSHYFATLARPAIEFAAEVVGIAPE